MVCNKICVCHKSEHLKYQLKAEEIFLLKIKFIRYKIL